MKHKDELHPNEKMAYENEMQVLQSKLSALQKILEDKDQVFAELTLIEANDYL